MSGQRIMDGGRERLRVGDRIIDLVDDVWWRVSAHTEYPDGPSLLTAEIVRDKTNEDGPFAGFVGRETLWRAHLRDFSPPALRAFADRVDAAIAEHGARPRAAAGPTGPPPEDR